MKKILFISALLLSFLGCKDSGGKKEVFGITKTKPNIILIISDDLTWHFIQPYGDRQVKTPNLERLADQGMTFDGFYTATAMCSPTRMQLYTGLYPVRNGGYPNHSDSYKGVKSLPDYLRPLGYRVGFAGKEDFGPSSDYPFKTVAGTHQLNKESYQEIRHFIDEDNAQPFALIIGSHQPHKPWNKGNEPAYNAKKLKVPPYLVDTPTTRKQLVKYFAEITYLDNQVGKVLKILKRSGKANNTIVIFTSEQGAQFPFAKWTCYENGLKTSFIVRWPGKVKAGSKNHALIEYVDVVPTLIAAAGGNPDTINTGVKDANGQSGFDGKSFLSVMLNNKSHFRTYVYGVQTTLGIIGAQAPYPIRSIGNGRYKLIRNLNSKAQFSNITETRDTSLIKSWERAGRHNINIAYRTSFYYKRPSIEFYDLKKDPYEMHNLAGDPRYNGIVKKLDEKLESWMKQQGDQGLKTELKAKSRNRKYIEKEMKKGVSSVNEPPEFEKE